MTAQGSAYMRFRRALDRGNVTEALSAGSELQVVALEDALALTLLIAEKEPAKYERAALRVHSRLVLEAKLGLPDAVASLALLGALPTRRSAGLALAELLSGRRETRIAEALVRWASEA